MSDRIVVDPITRIEGHLRVEVDVDGEQNIKSAYSSGTMVRGIETILKGRDPRDAWAYAQRICGVCTLVHGVASVRSVEDALKYPIPINANLIRNLMIAAQYVHDHVMHFYHLHALDWVDVVSALSANPSKTSEIARSISKWQKSSPGYFSDMQKKLKKFVDSKQLGIFANAYWGHKAYKLPAEVNLMATAHYLEALDWQKDVVQIHTIFGGKNPHPNFVVGGSPSPISVNSKDANTTALNINGLQTIRNVINKMIEFVNEVYVPDTIAIAKFYKDWFSRGEGVKNFLCFGDFPHKDIYDTSSFFIPRGVILDRDITKIHPVDLNDPAEIQEFISHSYYDYSKGKDVGLHPYDGETNLNYSGPKPPYKYLDVNKSYSWLKSPRWRGKAMEVGPLARVLMLYAKKEKQTVELVNFALDKLDVPVDALFSTLGRTAARTLETKIIGDRMMGWLDDLIANIKNGDTSVHNDELFSPDTWPDECAGVGFMEAPRGALAHWVVIKNKKVDNYQAVVPSTWNAGPIDKKGNRGPYEAALMDNHQLLDNKQPLEILRTIHSFDPCIACAVHIAGDKTDESIQIKVF
jgi:hydrogenase large subunit